MKMWGIRSAVVFVSAAGMLTLPLAGCSTSTSAASGTTAIKASVVPASSTGAASTGAASNAPSIPATSSAVDTAKTGVRLTAKVGDVVPAAQLAIQIKRAVRGKSAHTSQTTSQAVAPFTSTGVVSHDADGKAASRMTEKVAGQVVHVVYVDDVLYISVPTEGPGWLALRPGGTDALSKQFEPLLEIMRQAQDGGAALANGVLWKVISVDSTGVSYRAHVTVAKLRSAAGKLGIRAGAIPATGEDLTMVLSRSGMPLRTTVSLGNRTILVMRYSNWGPAIKITPPANATIA